MYGYTTFHPKIMQTLIDTVHHGRNSHAYIFEGDAGLGLKQAAQLFAAALTCTSTPTAPCGLCSACIQTKAQTNPDVVYVNSGEKKSISVDTMRGVSEDAYIRPFYKKHKVYIIEEGDLLTEQAQNAFLKVLEEPPGYVVFILLVTNATLLLQTILSRATLIHFSPVPEQVLKQYILDHYPEAEQRLPFLLKYANGNPGTADAVLMDENFESLREASLGKLTALLSPHRISSYEISDFMEQNKDFADTVLDFWISYLRDILMIQCDMPQNQMNIDKNLQPFVARFDPHVVVLAVEELFRAKQMLRRYVNLKALSLGFSLRIKEKTKALSL